MTDPTGMAGVKGLGDGFGARRLSCMDGNAEVVICCVLESR
jgi:hypothetical protein